MGTVARWTDTQWMREMDHWLEPFLSAPGRVERRHWAPVYLHGLLSPAPRRNVEQIAEQVAPDQLQQLHHFVSTSPWKTRPVQRVLVEQAQEIVVRRCMPRCPTCGRKNPSHTLPRTEKSEVEDASSRKRI